MFPQRDPLVTWSTADIPDLRGRTAVVTGANGGLGLETTRALAGRGAHVIMAARDQAKAMAARDEVLRGLPSASLELVALDLASLASVRDAAIQIVAVHAVVDLLFNNAGVMATAERRTVDGFEMQLGVNHLGHFALTAQLLPAILAGPSGRVVTTTSTAHHFGIPVDPANPHLEGRYRPWRAYGQSKLANYHFGLGLHHQFRDAGVQAQSLLAHPGLSNTGLQATSVTESAGGRSQRFFHRLASRTGMAPARGALPQLRAGTDPGARGGQLYAPRWVNFGPPEPRPVLRRVGMREAIRSLWEVSELETGTALDVATLARGL